MKNPYHLLEAGNYEKAMDEYTRLLAKYPDDECLLDGYPFACLCVGQLEEALEGFLKSNELARRRPIGEKQPYLIHVGVAQWLLGRREEALRTFRAGVDGILDGTIEYADASGGAKQGLLLWYAGVTLKNEDARDQALSFMRGLATKEDIVFWPGPLAAFAIGGLSTSGLLFRACGVPLLPVARIRAIWSGWVASHLMSSQFYMSVKCREAGNEERSLYWLRECTRYKGGNPPLEWHLAKQEVESQGSQVGETGENLSVQ